MISRFFFSALFGTLVGLIAAKASGPAAGLAAGLLSAAGFIVGGRLLRARLRKRQGQAPDMLPGETALLHGPGLVADRQGSAQAWLYLSDRRLLLHEEGGAAPVQIPLNEIEELRPPRTGWWTGGELALVAKGKGLLRLKVPDCARWHAAIQGALKNS